MSWSRFRGEECDESAAVADKLILLDNVGAAAEWLVETNRGRPQRVQSIRFVTRLLQRCRPHQAVAVIRLIDEFIPIASQKRMEALLLELVRMCIRNDIGGGYLDCFDRARRWRKLGWVSRRFSLIWRTKKHYRRTGEIPEGRRF